MRCFIKQGSAVRDSRHIPIYHFRIQLTHLAPVIACWLAEIDEVQQILSGPLQVTECWLDKLKKLSER